MAVLNATVDWMCLLSRGREFQTELGAWENEQCPDVLVLNCCSGITFLNKKPFLFGIVFVCGKTLTCSYFSPSETSSLQWSETTNLRRSETCSLQRDQQWWIAKDQCSLLVRHHDDGASVAWWLNNWLLGDFSVWETLHKLSAWSDRVVMLNVMIKLTPLSLPFLWYSPCLSVWPSPCLLSIKTAPLFIWLKNSTHSVHKDQNIWTSLIFTCCSFCLEFSASWF